MVNCAVFGCFNVSSNKKFKSNISFYSFPKNSDTCSKWINFCCREGKINIKYARICSEHFETKHRYWQMQHQILGYSPTLSRKIRPGAVPTLKPPETSIPRKIDIKRQKAREDRLQKRKDRLAERHLIQKLMYAEPGPSNMDSNEFPMVVDETSQPETQVSDYWISVGKRTCRLKRKNKKVGGRKKCRGCLEGENKKVGGRQGCNHE
uniref:THAP-type domain-containing protein n=1 Tax=Cacopsylla melanoneura TaxID=428564 RepID=A0A8D9BLQ3_9HEMI